MKDKLRFLVSNFLFVSEILQNLYFAISNDSIFPLLLYTDLFLIEIIILINSFMLFHKIRVCYKFMKIQNGMAVFRKFQQQFDIEHVPEWNHKK